MQLNNTFSIGDIVKVIVNTPDGCSEDVIVKDHVGVVSRVDYNGIYVCDGGVEYVYGADQLKLATIKELKDAFVNNVMRH